MKLYTLDLGWKGGVAVVAEGEEQAKELIAASYGLAVSHPAMEPDWPKLKEWPIEAGTIVHFEGE